jgi:hypothetical protein
VFNLAVGQIKVMEQTSNDRVRKLVNYFLEVARIGPRADVIKKWMKPNNELVDKLFKLKLPEILLRNEGVEKHADNSNIVGNVSQIDKKVEATMDISRNILKVTDKHIMSNVYPKSNHSIKHSFNTPERKQMSLLNYKIKDNLYAEQKSLSKESRLELRLSLLNKGRKISVGQYAGCEDILFNNFMDVNLCDSKVTESKVARNLLGVGQIEMGGLKRATNLNTVRELVEWYSTTNDFIKVYSLILYGVVSSKKADKLLCILHLLATKKLKYKVHNPYITI